MLAFCSLPAPHVFCHSPTLGFAPFISAKQSSNTASCHGDRKIAVTLGMGAGPVSRGTGLKSASPINPQGVPRLSAFILRQGTVREKDSLRHSIPHGLCCRRGVFFCCICYHCHWKKKKKKKAYASVFPKSFPVSQIFGHLWSKSQFSAISRGPSRLVLAGNRGGQQGPCRETRRFLGLDKDCGESPAPSARGRQEPR